MAEETMLVKVPAIAVPTIALMLLDVVAENIFVFHVRILPVRSRTVGM